MELRKAGAVLAVKEDILMAILEEEWRELYGKVSF